MNFSFRIPFNVSLTTYLVTDAAQSAKWQLREINHKEKNIVLLISGFMLSSHIYVYLDGVHKYISNLIKKQ